MTLIEARQVIENSQLDYDCYDEIYEGLTILKKYHKDTEFDYSFAHDQIWCCINFADSVVLMSDEDITLMGSMGWIESEDYWSHF